MMIVGVLCAIPFTALAADETLDRTLGTMLIFGVKGHELHVGNPVLKALEQGRIGGIIIYEKSNIRNREQLAEFCQNIQKSARGGAFIMIDQEGGVVNRLKEKYGFPSFPSHQNLADMTENEHGTSSLFKTVSKAMQTMHEVGINMNLAPVVDVNINQDSPAIGHYGRSFGESPDQVVTNAEAFIRASEQEGVIPVIKHFPGHGSAIADSHNGLTDISKTWQADNELKPYRDLFKRGYKGGVLVGHLFVKQLDDQYPVSLSKKIVQNLLRRKMGWNGLVISDAYRMSAITKHYTIEQIMENSINAGIDLLLFANDYSDEYIEKLYGIFHELVDSGRISKKAVRDAGKRIEVAKRTYKIK